ncbi:NADH:flavin oxidoreductase [Clostridium kluyveri]|uniref:Predicted NADH oxidase n=2 Tax=Clostridium kluyveri TaxID=1534 RepID=A5N517_CLOK5|nr:NADH:flavin oxidoreductase [Clostridium kluyveri]EDK32398.1 Predicted NADH oxidase [Clostridium kluyveri DSM 555]
MNYLNKPLDTGKLLLKNRLIMPPMATAKSGIDGRISKDILDYYDEKSRGGYISLIIIEHSFVSQQGKASNNQVSIAQESMVEDLKKLAEIIHKNGCKTIMQINHAGSAANVEVTGMEIVGPSAVPNPFGTGMPPKELQKNEIKTIVNEFKEAALRVKNAGFDGVEIHSAHGYLLNQFLSPITNKRQDEYGGDITGRIKIHRDIVKNVREAVGESFPIFMRLGASDYMDGGLTIEDSKLAAQQLEKTGVDVLDISGGLCRYTIPGVNEEGYFTPLSKAIKEVVSIPVIVTGGIIHAKTADEILSRGEADLIGVGRAIYKDSDWARNAMK